MRRQGPYEAACGAHSNCLVCRLGSSSSHWQTLCWAPEAGHHALCRYLQLPGVDTDIAKRTITVDYASLVPSTSGDDVTNGCASLLGKFKVTDFKATSWHDIAKDQTADDLPTAYFYIGAQCIPALWLRLAGGGLPVHRRQACAQQGRPTCRGPLSPAPHARCCSVLKVRRPCLPATHCAAGAAWSAPNRLHCDCRRSQKTHAAHLPATSIPFVCTCMPMLRPSA